MFLALWLIAPLCFICYWLQWILPEILLPRGVLFLLISSHRSRLRQKLFQSHGTQWPCQAGYQTAATLHRHFSHWCWWPAYIQTMKGPLRIKWSPSFYQMWDNILLLSLQVTLWSGPNVKTCWESLLVFMGKFVLVKRVRHILEVNVPGPCNI